MMHAHPPLFRQAPEAVVGVYRPRLGYAYGLQWKVPENEPLLPEEREKLYRSQRELLHPKNEQAKNRAAAKALLEKVLCEVAKLADDAQLNEPKACAMLFGFNRETGSLDRIADELCESLYLNSVRWGRDIIGTAFQRQSPVFYSKNSQARRPGEVAWDLSRNLPESIQVLLGFPLPGLIPRHWPIAVLAIASTDGESGLHRLIGQAESLDVLKQRISALWSEYLPPIMGKEM